jgi:hypothetical protein
MQNMKDAFRDDEHRKSIKHNLDKVLTNALEFRRTSFEVRRGTVGTINNLTGMPAEEAKSSSNIQLRRDKMQKRHSFDHGVLKQVSELHILSCLVLSCLCDMTLFCRSVSVSLSLSLSLSLSVLLFFVSLSACRLECVCFTGSIYICLLSCRDRYVLLSVLFSLLVSSVFVGNSPQGVCVCVSSCLAFSCLVLGLFCLLMVFSCLMMMVCVCWCCLVLSCDCLVSCPVLSLSLSFLVFSSLLFSSLAVVL